MVNLDWKIEPDDWWQSMTSFVAKTVHAAIVGSLYEIVAFVTLSLVLQASLAFRFISPILAEWDTHDLYMLIGFLCLLSYMVVPTLSYLISVACAPNTPIEESNYMILVKKLPDDAMRWMTMLLTSIFLATVTKVAFPVRFELVSACTLAIIGAFFSRFTDATVLEHYFVACFRQAAISMVGYAVVPNFDASFGHLVRRCASFAQSQVLVLKSYIF